MPKGILMRKGYGVNSSKTFEPLSVNEVGVITKEDTKKIPSEKEIVERKSGYEALAKKFEGLNIQRNKKKSKLKFEI